MLRSFVVSCLALFVTGCGLEPVEQLVTERERPPVAPVVTVAPEVFELPVAARLSFVDRQYTVAHVDAGVALSASEHSFALGTGFPSQFLFMTRNEYLATRDCVVESGPAQFARVVEVQGDAATVSLTPEGIVVDLIKEGDVVATIEGQVVDVACQFSGVDVTTVPLRHRLTLHVREVAGFELPQGRCEGRVVLPTEAVHPLPPVLPVDSAGRSFEALNAPLPVSYRLVSNAPLLSAGDAFLAAAGHVEVKVDTTLPVRGLTSFEVVGPEAVTSLTAAFMLTMEVSKGDVSQRIVDGASYVLFFPDRPNVVEFRVESVDTTAGHLCSNVPAGWLRSVSSTPQQCAASALTSTVVGEVLNPGRCRLDVSLAGTSHRWSADFSTRVR